MDSSGLWKQVFPFPLFIIFLTNFIVNTWGTNNIRNKHKKWSQKVALEHEMDILDDFTVDLFSGESQAKIMHKNKQRKAVYHLQ